MIKLKDLLQEVWKADTLLKRLEADLSKIDYTERFVWHPDNKFEKMHEKIDWKIEELVNMGYFDEVLEIWNKHGYGDEVDLRRRLDRMGFYDEII